MSTDICPRCGGLIGRCRCPATTYEQRVYPPVCPICGGDARECKHHRFERERDDIVSGNVWPDREDPMYLEWLERRVSDLTSQLATAEELLAAADRRDRRTLNVVVAQLEAEEHRPPPRQS